jgi:hypothetical protein
MEQAPADNVIVMPQQPNDWVEIDTQAALDRPRRRSASASASGA